MHICTICLYIYIYMYMYMCIPFGGDAGVIEKAFDVPGRHVFVDVRPQEPRKLLTDATDY
jgi:hypothetical protein